MIFDWVIMFAYDFDEVNRLAELVKSPDLIIEQFNLVYLGYETTSESFYIVESKMIYPLDNRSQVVIFRSRVYALGCDKEINLQEMLLHISIDLIHAGTLLIYLFVTDAKSNRCLHMVIRSTKNVIKIFDAQAGWVKAVEFSINDLLSCLQIYLL